MPSASSTSNGSVMGTAIMVLGRLTYRPACPATVGGAGGYLSGNRTRETRQCSPAVPVMMASPGAACTNPSEVCTVQAMGVNLTSISRSSLRATTRRGSVLISFEYPRWPLERNRGNCPWVILERLLRAPLRREDALAPLPYVVQAAHRRRQRVELPRRLAQQGRAMGLVSECLHIQCCSQFDMLPLIAVILGRKLPLEFDDRSDRLRRIGFTALARNRHREPSRQLSHIAPIADRFDRRMAARFGRRPLGPFGARIVAQ